MTDGPREPESGPQCPVDASTQRWIESSMRWLTEQFGTVVLRREVILPTADFISPDYSATPQQVDTLVRHLCSLMNVDPALVQVDLFDGSAEKHQAARLGKSRAVGHFHMHDGRAIIGLDTSEASDPVLLTAIAVHELGHVKLLGERRITNQRSDHERLTDLLTVYFGFGIFTTNAALRFARNDRGWSIVPHGDLDDMTLNAARRNDTYSRLGYLRSSEFGYALSCCCWLRQETEPAWGRMLTPGPLSYLNQGLAYLASSGRSGELPTQRVVNKSAKLGTVTIRVTSARSPSLGSLGILLPHQTGEMPPG